VATFVLGVEPLAATVAGTVGTIITLFVHWNVPTPRWVGYVLLRPEQHCLHHEFEVHARNYGNDLAIWDQLFGSFRNPPRFNGRVGFDRPFASTWPGLLTFADVNGERSASQ
jgi:sterol desaturase/sphingolipid hydroxylase (fatty acid hydroxylase superfamily)